MKCVFLKGCTFSEKYGKACSPFFEKAGEKDVSRKRSIARFASAPFFKKVLQKEYCTFFRKGATKKMKGEELSTVPLPFNSLSFKRFRASP